MTGSRLKATPHGDAIVVSPHGRLDPSTYTALREELLKHVAEGPSAVIVVLGPDLDVVSDPLTSVFATVWLRTSPWSGTPLILVATTGGQRRLVVRTGLSRFLPCYDRLDAALDATDALPERRRDEARLTADADAPRLAQDFTRRACAAWRLPDVAPHAVPVAGHLARTMPRAAGVTLVVTAELFPSRLTLATRHRGGPPRRATTHPDLARVRRLTVACGSLPTFGDGPLLWASLLVRPR
ncbi:hypothetical protein SUDANB95_03454 [Actinosynnema sp. ALI-1.44]